MGIIMCLLMGVALMLIKPLRLLSVGRQYNEVELDVKGPRANKTDETKLNKKVLLNVFAQIIFFGGCWNTFWYGFNAMNSFWGVVAIVSGILMILASLFIFLRVKTAEQDMSHDSFPYSIIFEWLLSIGLLAFFLLYLITLVRLNLGLSIIL